MIFLSKIIIALIALEHLYILWIEMFAWTSVGKKVFRGAMPPNMFEATRVLAANQGLYNGFLAAGLIWSLLIPNPIWSQNVATFFLACVAIAGIYGSLTAAKSIFFVQALPAIIGLIIVLMSNN
ncbi:MAG: DUF1304 domain-containing protein [Chitinophagales bacterium]|jgi:putative membrane protein|nr:DUF1304 domain-containing protein [Chitinophagales bacterium]MBP7533409.1 DUF1304 domain-containing protein [Chitinophagales bacterium]